MFAVWVAYWWGRGHMQSLVRESTTARTTSPSLSDIYLTLESNRWRLQHFWKGMPEFYFTGCFVFSRRGFILAGLLLRSAALSSPPLFLSIYLCPLFISILYFSLRRCLFLTASPPFDKLLRFCITKHTRNSSHEEGRKKKDNHTVKVLWRAEHCSSRLMSS